MFDHYGFFLCLSVSVSIFGGINAQDILGCGGFVKSEVEINYSVIEIKLYTKQGSLKYQTDCAPNNGYYMVPVYDKGDYILKVEPPSGWTFEPEIVELHVDGQTDACSRSEDINFQFTGFGVIGRVVSQGYDKGPAGVTLNLKKSKSSDVLQTATSGENGDYFFEKVLPGEYIVESQHAKWRFKPDSVPINIKTETAYAPNVITALGFDVQGRVLSEGEPIQGVNFVLFSRRINPASVFDCDKKPLSDFPVTDSESEEKQICHVTSQKDGRFLFPTLPCGEYKLVPFYKGEHITFDVAPIEMSFVVNHQSLVLQEDFQVTGFSVSGKVLASKKGSGVPDARIVLDGKELTKTSTDGTYHLDSMKAGSYSIDVQADQIFFDTTTVKITPNTPELPDLVAARFSVCGRVVIDKLPEGLPSSSAQSRKVKIEAKGQKPAEVTLVAENDGKFCTELKPGSYIFKAQLSDGEVRAGLKLAPYQKEIKVSDKPVEGVVFSQFRAKVSGTVNCLENCGLLQLSLSAIGRSEEKKIVQAMDIPRGTRFSFDDVLPGKYRVTLHHELWCWREKMLEVEIIDQDVENVEFQQSGYILSCSLSHDIMLNFAQEGKPGNVGSFNLTKGLNKFCLTQPGTYKLSPVSCHQFEQEVYSYDTSNPSVLTLTAVRHLTEGAIVTQQRQNDIMVTIRSSIKGEGPTELGPLLSDKEPAVPKDPKQKVPEPKGPFTYGFNYLARTGETLTISVSSKELLFYPESSEVTVQGDTCPGLVAQFEGKKGVFISGSVQPSLAGVKITIAPQDQADKKIEVETNANGGYRVGPLHGGVEYVVDAEKEGYILSAVEGKYGDFKAFKLAEIAVLVVDEEDKPLSGVLLSLSGGQNYRSNNLTKNNGAMNFLSLSPGQYFLRPVMKEYHFNPSSKMIEVKEGVTENVKVKGTRVAFSAYGSVTSLNGEPEQGVFVEAVGRGSSECQNLEEDSKTEPDGTFRIRGLQPGCQYELRLKSGDFNQHIERAAPKSRTVQVVDKDMTDVNVIAFRRINQLDLSGNVITSLEYLSNLKVHLYRESNIDAPLHTVSLGPTTFFHLPSLTMDGQNYLLRLDSTLSRSSYEYTLSEVVFTANTTYRHFTFKFNPKRKSVDQELSQGSFLILPLTIAVVLISYNYQKILPMLSSGAVALKGMLNRPPTAATATSSAPAQEVSPELLEELTLTKKKARVRKA